MPEIDEILREFLIETSEQLEDVERGLMVLEGAPDDHEEVAALFRNVHTIKGTCGFFGFQQMAALTHAGEHLLAGIRDGELRYNADIATALLALVDVLRAMTESIGETGEEGAEDHAALRDELTRLRTPGATAATPPRGDAPSAPDEPPPHGGPGASGPHPGASGPHPGATGPHPGTASPHPGTASQRLDQGGGPRGRLRVRLEPTRLGPGLPSG